MPELRLIGSKEAAELLGITRSKLQRLVHQGRLAPATKGEGLRGAMVFSAEDVERYRNSRESGGGEHTDKRALLRKLYDDAEVPLSDEDANALAYRLHGAVPTRRGDSTPPEDAA